MIGGYQIVSLGGNNLANGVGETLPGLYGKLESAHGKPIMLADAVFDGKEHTAFFPDFCISGGNYTCTVCGGTLVVTSDDLATYTADV